MSNDIIKAVSKEFLRRTKTDNDCIININGTPGVGMSDVAKMSDLLKNKIKRKCPNCGVYVQALNTILSNNRTVLRCKVCGWKGI